MIHYRPEIDGLRAIAVLSVVLFHAGVPGMGGGYVGVDIFFVISGYLITRIIYDDLVAGRFSIVDFYERRARRILPALIVLIGASLCAAWLLLLPYQFRDLSKEALSAALFYSNIRFFVKADYFAPDSEFSILLHTWSLAVEEQFYIVFPILLYALHRGAARFVIPVIAVLALASLAVSQIWLTDHASASFFLAPSRAWELGIGSLLALGRWQMPLGRPLREVLAVAGLGALIVPVIFYDADTPFPGLMALMPCIGAAAIITTGANGPAVALKLLSLRPIVFVGLISYSLYLWHWPILAFVRNVKGDISLTALEALVAVTAAFVAATASWVFVERPFRRRAPGGFGRRAIFSMSLAGAACIAATAGAVHLIEISPWRQPEAVRAAVAALNDKNPDRERCFKRTPSEGLCRFGAPKPAETPADFILWGDSHADAIMPGVAEAARAAGKTGLFAARGACIPALGLNRAHGKDGLNYCSSFNDAIIAHLEAREDARLVVLIGRWPLWVEGDFLSGENGKPFILSKAGTDQVPTDTSQNFRLFEDALIASVRRIRATGRTVVILGGIPEPGWNVPKLVISHLQWKQPLPAIPTRETVAARHKRADAVLAGIPGVKFVNVAERMCAGPCTLLADGRLLYYDDDHLSAYGAHKFIAPIFAEIFGKPSAQIATPAP